MFGRLRQASTWTQRRKPPASSKRLRQDSSSESSCDENHKAQISALDEEIDLARNIKGPLDELINRKASQRWAKGPVFSISSKPVASSLPEECADAHREYTEHNRSQKCLKHWHARAHHHPQLIEERSCETETAETSAGRRISLLVSTNTGSLMNLQRK